MNLPRRNLRAITAHKFGRGKFIIIRRNMSCHGKQTRITNFYSVSVDNLM